MDNADITISLNLNGNTLSSIKSGTATLTFCFSGGSDQSLSTGVSDSTPSETAPESPVNPTVTIKNGRAIK